MTLLRALSPARYRLDPQETYMASTKKKSAKVLRCPTCGGLVQRKDEDFPFCSDRCRKIDLGKWAMGVYKITSPVLDPEVLEDLGGLAGGQGKGDDHE
jgi:uncharacterized protein